DKRYGDASFTCDGGKLIIPSAQVNDDYCDCEDGTDEPGTSACATGTFYCENTLHKPMVIPSNRVHDGICDCCDGSDEASGCEDICDKIGQVARAEAERVAKVQHMGYQMKLIMISEVADAKKKVADTIVQLKQDLYDHEEERTRLQAVLDEVKAVKQAEEAAAAEKEEVADEQAPSDDGDDASDDSAEKAATTDADSDDEDFFDDEDEADADEVPQEDIKLTIRDLEKQVREHRYKKSPLEVELRKLEKQLDADIDYGENEEWFKLSLECLKHKAEGDTFEYELCPFDQVKQTPGNINLGKTFEWSGGPETDENPLGQYSEMTYTDGQQCWKGPPRSTTIRVLCDITTRIENVNEPNKCVYSMDLYTPLACTEPVERPDEHESGDEIIHDEI
ncbi:hypothetical protein SARC_10872, partial [Sphaeroforma arctica JP610]